MITEPIFFEIPIYRCESEKHRLEFDVKFDGLLKEIDKINYPTHHENYLQFLNEYVFYEWKYNEIVGYLNLYILGSQLRADYYFIDKKKN